MSGRIDPIRWSSLASNGFRCTRSFSAVTASFKGYPSVCSKNLHYLNVLGGGRQRVARFALLNSGHNSKKMPHVINIYYPRWVTFLIGNQPFGCKRWFRTLFFLLFLAGISLPILNYYSADFGNGNFFVCSAIEGRIFFFLWKIRKINISNYLLLTTVQSGAK